MSNKEKKKTKPNEAVKSGAPGNARPPPKVKDQKKPTQQSKDTPSKTLEKPKSIKSGRLAHTRYAVPALRDVADGIETDPVNATAPQFEFSQDRWEFEIDAKRCITQHANTRGEVPLVEGQLDPVIRVFWRKPGRYADGSVDPRGVCVRERTTKITIKNPNSFGIQIKGSSMRSFDRNGEHVDTRISEFNRTLGKQAEFVATVKEGEHGFPYSTVDAAGDTFYHVVDFYVVIPDHPYLRKAVNSVITTEKGTELLNTEDAWDPDAEICSVVVEATYTTSPPSQDQNVSTRLDGYFYLQFSRDLNTLYAVSRDMVIRGGKLLPSTKASVDEAPYDISLEGWIGLGVALYEHVDGFCVPYLAKFPKVSKTCLKRNGGVKPKMLDRYSRDNAYPAFRLKKLEDGQQILFPGGFFYHSDSDGYDSGCGNSTFVWSPTHEAFVQWNFATGKPYYVESGFAYPHYYCEWIAALPPIGVLQVHNTAASRFDIPIARFITVDEPGPRRKGTGRAIEWGMIITCVVYVLRFALTLADILHDDVNAGHRAPAKTSRRAVNNFAGRRLVGSAQPKISTGD